MTLSDPCPAEIFLSHGAKMDSSLLFSAIGGHTWTRGTATLELLIQRGADINCVSERWGTPLFHAVDWVKEDQLRILLDNGANPAYRDD